MRQIKRGFPNTLWPIFAGISPSNGYSAVARGTAEAGLEPG